MKKIVSGIFILLYLVGCSSSSITGPLSSNAEYVELLSDDEKLDFILDGVYYEIPFKVSQLTENGWNIYENHEDLEFAELEPEEFIAFLIYQKNNNFITISIFNQGEETISASEGEVYQIDFKIHKDESNKDFLVITKGIIIGSDAKTVAKALNVSASKASDSQFIYLSNGFDDYYILRYDDKAMVKEISILYDIYDLHYSSYEQNNIEEDRDVEQEIADYKEKAVKNTNEYLPSNYDQLMDEINTSAYKVKPIYVKGTVIEYYTAISDKSSSEKYVYIFESEDGYYFASEFNILNHIKYEIGDEVEIWGNVMHVQLNDSRGALFVVDGRIVILNGEEIINMFTR